MAAFDSQEDYYAILGLSPDANPEDIDIAKRTLLPKWHPDNNSDPSAAEMSQKITEAHSVLSDFRKRFAYDNDRFKERSPVHRFLYQRFISDGLRENPSQLSNFLYTKVGVPISKRALNRANAGRYNPNIESRLVTQARQDYLTAARKAFRGLGLMPFGRDYNYDAEICEYFDKTLMGYKNSPPEPQEKPKRLNPTINSSIEKDIKFFNGLQGKKREFTAFCTSQSFDLTSSIEEDIFQYVVTGDYRKLVREQMESRDRVEVNANSEPQNTRAARPEPHSNAPHTTETSDDTVDGTENQQSTPASSQQRQNPFQKLGQRIASLPWIGRIKTGALGIAAAAVITTDPLRQWVGHQRKGTLILGAAGGVTAAAAGIALVANPFRGNGGNGSSPAPATDPAPTTPPAGAPTPSTPAPESGTAGEALLTKFDEAIRWRSNPGNFGDIPGQGGDHPLRALLNLQGKQGLASPNAQISGGTRDELIKLAGAANVDSDKILTAYQTGYNNAYINAYAPGANVTFGENVTESVHAHAMTESLKAVKAVIAQEQEYKTSFLGRFETLVGNILPKGAPANAAEGPPMMQSSTPNPLATMMHGAVSRLEGVAHNVAVVAQHPAAQAAMRGLGVVGVVASVAATVHAARSGNTALAVMNGAAAVATAAAMAGLPPLAAAMGAARIGAYAADRSQTGTLDRVLAQREELTTKLATLNAEPKTVGNTVQTVTTHVALATKKADVLASQQFNALRENVQSGVEATSEMLTKAQGVAGNAVASTKENLGKLQQRFANLFTHRQTTAAL